MTEEQLQVQCAEWFWNNYHQDRQMVFHVNNNSWNSVQGNRNRARGVVAGVSDFVLVLHHAIIFVELKLPGKFQQKEQLSFESKVVGRGHSYKIIYSFEEWKQLIIQLYGKPASAS